jgi:2-polyprenyl-3-methyl-5-hydroxy-6-metoxy-1,4-benzoquinol methylase
LRITYRNINNKDYWNNRWEDIPTDEPMTNTNAYPLKYSEMLIKNSDGQILEAGCGNGRILRYYHGQGYNIIGLDFIEVAIDKLNKTDPTLRVEVGDIT